MLAPSNYPLSTSVIELRFITDTVDCFYRMAPFYLAAKLPSLQRLVIDGGDQPFANLHWQHKARLGRTYLGHPSLSMYLKHFRNVTELRLSYITFQSFWDFRRFLDSLPALARLHVDQVNLPRSDPFRRPDGRVQSLFSPPQHLTQFSISAPLCWNPLWIWVVPSTPRYRKPTSPL